MYFDSLTFTAIGLFVFALLLVVRFCICDLQCGYHAQKPVNRTAVGHRTACCCTQHGLVANYERGMRSVLPGATIRQASPRVSSTVRPEQEPVYRDKQRSFLS